MIKGEIEARIQEGLEQAQQGIFAPDTEMKEFFAQYADNTWSDDFDSLCNSPKVPQLDP